MILFKDLIETLRDYTKDWSALGIIRLCIDLLLVGFTLFFIYKLLRAKIPVINYCSFSSVFLLLFACLFPAIGALPHAPELPDFGVWVCSSSFTHRRSGIHWNIFSAHKNASFYNQTGKRKSSIFFCPRLNIFPSEEWGR